jgi:8-hydroxy-5-deazaflavin:NADPH oxidoreductase
MKVSIIGSGNMARGIGTRAVNGGNEVEIVGHQPGSGQALADELGGGASAADSPSGDVVVLAVPYGAVEEVFSQHGDTIGGKVVVDITNPVDWSTMDRVVTPAGSSAGEEIAKSAPQGARVVKAFNTTFAPTLVAGEAGGQQLDVLIAGDDEDAKKTVSELVESGGLRALDVGPLSKSRQLEQLGLFHITAQEPLGAGFGSALKLHW